MVAEAKTLSFLHTVEDTKTKTTSAIGAVVTVTKLDLVSES